MVKKKGELTATKLGTYILAAVTVALLFYIFLIQEEGGLSRLDRTVQSLKESVPDFTKNLQAEEITSTQTIIPKEHLGAIRSLKNAINSTLLSDKNNCFTEYGSLPELGHRETSIEFRYENGKTTMLVFGGDDGRKLLPELTSDFEKMIPCVIAGSDEVAENFFTKFVEKKEVAGNYYQPTNYVRLFYWEGEQQGGIFTACNNGNRIMTLPPQDRIGWFTGNTGWRYDQGPNENCDNLQDGGIIFSPDNKHICFMPTNYVDNADEHGIENGFISGTKSGSISLQLTKGEVQQC